MRNASFELTLYGCVVFVYCVGDEVHDRVLAQGEPFGLNAFATVLIDVCSSIIIECCVLYPCCVGVLGMFAVM